LVLEVFGRKRMVGGSRNAGSCDTDEQSPEYALHNPIPPNVTSNRPQEAYTFLVVPHGKRSLAYTEGPFASLVAVLSSLTTSVIVIDEQHLEERFVRA
jgi:hypothetical protein